MKKQYVSDLIAGSDCDSLFVAKNKRLAESRNKPGHPVLSMILRDRTGEVSARAPDNGAALAQRFDDGDVIHVQGRVEQFNRAPQVAVSSLHLCPRGEYELDDFIPHTPKNIEDLISTIQDAISDVQNQYLRTLLERFYKDDLFLSEFKRAPAAKVLHHAYIGGLAEHFCSVLVIARALCANYPHLDPDILTTGVLLHDIGKLRELHQGTTFNYTDSGRLLGHIYMGAQMVTEKIRTIEGFPHDLEMRVVHMILSHHGTREHGAITLPATAEAYALHLVENADAQMHQFFRVVESVADPEQKWTDYDRSFQRHLFTGRGELTLEW